MPLSRYYGMWISIDILIVMLLMHRYFKDFARHCKFFYTLYSVEIVINLNN